MAGNLTMPLMCFETVHLRHCRYSQNRVNSCIIKPSYNYCTRSRGCIAMHYEHSLSWMAEVGGEHLHGGCPRGDWHFPGGMSSGKWQMPYLHQKVLTVEMLDNYWCMTYCMLRVHSVAKEKQKGTNSQPVVLEQYMLAMEPGHTSSNLK